ncbi:MAG: triose-phosphate isomerase [Ignavibacteriales bacterium CG12_big_fil_rev_8_21_14_0_65_30_8]|nr:MAG: triose-phosphate isomerase [Ignavibacteriales bacterium CG12_big_fil_rev_8_21_14_0_65_30_8]
MRRRIIAGNWKMHNNISESQNLVSKLVSGLTNQNLIREVIICPPFTSLCEISNLLKDTKVELGAQNMHFEEKGAFTGEISSDMLKSVGCKYVILGHSERRTIFGETDELISKKIKKALTSDLTPIFCIGESLEQRENGTTNDVIKRQVLEGIKDLTEEEVNKIIIAYEPIWAIGTGKTATPEQAQEVHKFIRSILTETFSETVSEKIPILYGGSVKPNNAEDLLAKEDIDGALVGGACLEAESFISIIKA